MSNVTLTIEPTPSTATVTLTASGYMQVGNTITVPEGTTVSYAVYKEYYVTKTGVYAPTADTTIGVEIIKPTSIDSNVVCENVAELLTNSVNMTTKFYDLFINPTPMDVSLKMYNDQNQLITVTVPNRAKDRRIAITGNNSPEGVVTANVGSTYVDVIQRKVYYKTQGSEATGWTLVLTSEVIPAKISDLEDDTATYPIDKADTLTGLTATVSELNYCDGVTSNIQTQLDNKQNTLVSGTNIKTINSNSILGSGNLDINGLPSQSGQSGKYLTTDGNSASWGVIDLSLSNLSDANISAPLNGQVLKYNSSTSKWENGASANSLVDLTDVQITSVQNNDMIMYNSTATKFKNVTTNVIIPMITSFVNGTSGYNIWANGYCEQWGVINATGGGVDISLTKTFKDTNYSILTGTTYNSDATAIYSYAIITTTKTVNSFRVYGTNSNYGCYWKACGYLAESEY